MHLYERLQQPPRMTFKTFFNFLENYSRTVESEIQNNMNILTKVLTNHIISNLNTMYNIKNANSVSPYFYEGNHDQLVLVEADISEEKLKSSIRIPPYKVSISGENYDYLIDFDFRIKSYSKILFSIDPTDIQYAIVEHKGLKNAFIKLVRNTTAKVFTDLLVRFSILKSVNSLDVGMTYDIGESPYSSTFELRHFNIKINNNCELELSIVGDSLHFELYVSDKKLMNVRVFQRDYDQIMYNYFYRVFSNLK